MARIKKSPPTITSKLSKAPGKIDDALSKFGRYFVPYARRVMPIESKLPNLYERRKEVLKSYMINKTTKEIVRETCASLKKGPSSFDTLFEELLGRYKGIGGGFEEVFQNYLLVKFKSSRPTFEGVESVRLTRSDVEKAVANLVKALNIMEVSSKNPEDAIKSAIRSLEKIGIDAEDEREVSLKNLTAIQAQIKELERQISKKTTISHSWFRVNTPRINQS